MGNETNFEMLDALLFTLIHSGFDPKNLMSCPLPLNQFSVHL